MARRTLDEIELPCDEGWVNFWVDDQKYTLAGEGGGVWVVLRASASGSVSELVRFVETGGGWQTIGEGTSEPASANPWRTIVTEAL